MNAFDLLWNKYLNEIGAHGTLIKYPLNIRTGIYLSFDPEYLLKNIKYLKILAIIHETQED